MKLSTIILFLYITMFIYLHIFIIEAARGDFFYKVRSADKLIIATYKRLPIPGIYVLFFNTNIKVIDRKVTLQR